MKKFTELTKIENKTIQSILLNKSYTVLTFEKWLLFTTRKYFMFINRCFINYFIVATVFKCLWFAPYSSSLTINNSYKSLIMSIMNCRRQLNWGLRRASNEEDCHALRDRDLSHLTFVEIYTSWESVTSERALQTNALILVRSKVLEFVIIVWDHVFVFVLSWRIWT